MSRHQQFYKDLKSGADYAAHPDDFYDEDDHEHYTNHGQQEYVCIYYPLYDDMIH